MMLLPMIYLCSSHPPDATWKMLPSSIVVLYDRMINGRNIIDAKSVLRNNTGITALSRSDSFLKES